MGSPDDDAQDQHDGTSSPWDHAVHDIPQVRLVDRARGDPGRAAPVARALDLVACTSLRARLHHRPDRCGTTGCRARLRAEIEPGLRRDAGAHRQHDRGRFEADFWPQEDMPAPESGELDIDDEPEREPIVAGQIAVGRVVFESLAAAIDPFPRKPGAVLDWHSPASADDLPASPKAPSRSWQYQDKGLTASATVFALQSWISALPDGRESGCLAAATGYGRSFSGELRSGLGAGPADQAGQAANRWTKGVMAAPRTISLDAMGGDEGPGVVVPGRRHRPRAPSRRDLPVVRRRGAHQAAPASSIRRWPSGRASCTPTPSSRCRTSRARRVRRGRGSSMWLALEAVQKREADFVVSAGNTGALMAMAKLVLTHHARHRAAGHRRAVADRATAPASCSTSAPTSAPPRASSPTSR